MRSISIGHHRTSGAHIASGPAFFALFRCISEGFDVEPAFEILVLVDLPGDFALPSPAVPRIDRGHAVVVGEEHGFTRALLPRFRLKEPEERSGTAPSSCDRVRDQEDEFRPVFHRAAGPRDIVGEHLTVDGMELLLEPEAGSSELRFLLERGERLVALPEACEIDVNGGGLGLRIKPGAHERRGTTVGEFGDADEVRLEEVPDHIDEGMPHSFGALRVVRQLPAPGLVVGVCEDVEVGMLEGSQADRGMHGNLKGQNNIISQQLIRLLSPRSGLIRLIRMSWCWKI